MLVHITELAQSVCLLNVCIYVCTARQSSEKVYVHVGVNI